MKRALAFLTAFGGSATPTGSTFAWFPLVGALIGLAVGGIWWTAARWWPPALAGAVALVADLALTGLLHVDGLADTADGLIAPLSRPARLAAMADPAVGAFGVIGVVAVLVTRWAAFASARPSPLLLAGLWSASRASMVAISLLMSYARPEGLVTSFLGPRSRSVTTVGAVVLGYLAGLAICLTLGWRAVSSFCIGLVGSALVAWFAQRRLGGYTGDVLGASGVVGETLALMVWALR